MTDPAFANFLRTARRRVAHGRLLSERPRVAGPQESEVRPHFRALRNLSRRPARRERLIWRGRSNPQRRREQKLEMFQQYVPDIQDALPLPAEDRPSKRVWKRPWKSWTPHSASGDLRARISGGGRQPAKRSARPRGKRQQEDFLQELHGCTRELRHPAGGEALMLRRIRRRKFPAKAIC